MGVQLQFGTAGATGGGFSSQPGSLQPAFVEGRHGPQWCWQKRSPKTRNDPICWRSVWSYGCRVGGGDLEGYSVSGRGIADSDPFEPYSCNGPGNQSKRFIKGTVLDSDSNPVSGALVQGFVTATDAFVGEVQSNQDGSYTLPTDTLPGVAHYLVAYKPGSPDIAGTTVNTLTSTLVDGT